MKAGLLALCKAYNEYIPREKWLETIL